MDDYEAVFGGGSRRLLRGSLLGAVVGLTVEQLPRFRDAWTERSTGLEIAIYCHIPEITKTGVAEKVFNLRANPYYRNETVDSFGYITFRFGIPAETDLETLNAISKTSVDPVDTDVRWATALGQTLKGTE